MYYLTSMAIGSMLTSATLAQVAPQSPTHLRAADSQNSQSPEGHSMTEKQRHERGLEILKQVGGSNYDAPLKSLDAIAPDLARYTVEFAYGDIMSRQGLDLRIRQIATVAALAAMGNAAPQLRYHIEGALNVGCDPSQIVEAILLNAVYAGFPSALNGISAAKEVFERRAVKPAASELERKEGARYDRGLRALNEVSGGSGADVVKSLEQIAPDLGRFIIEFSYGDIISRPGLDYRTKELATVAMLTALGTAAPQLKVHIGGALKVGATREEIVEVIQQMAVYAGFPAALNGIGAAREVFTATTR
jgi:4-carboxymuconolactone decarboxylase